MPYAEWVQEVLMQPNSTCGICLNLRLDIYPDGHGWLSCTDKPNVRQPVTDSVEVQRALHRLWERGMREATRSNLFKA